MKKTILYLKDGLITGHELALSNRSDGAVRVWGAKIGLDALVVHAVNDVY